jgi:hypothetical protein
MLVENPDIHHQCKGLPFALALGSCQTTFTQPVTHLSLIIAFGAVTITPSNNSHSW